MKHLLLTGLFMAAVSVVNATDLTTTTFSPQAVKSNVSAPVRNSVQFNRPVRRALPVMDQNIINVQPARKSSAVAADAASDAAFYESFEAWPMFTADYELDFEWLPEGWTAKRNCSPLDNESWFPFMQYNYYYPAPAEGQYYFMIMYSSEHQDEWLITPDIEVGEGMDLTYYLYYQPIFLFSMDNYDYYKDEFIGEKVVTVTFQVLVQAEGDEDWTVIEDLADHYKDYDAAELYAATPTGLEKQTISLADYAGKKVKLAFRYVGTDGDSMWLDAIRVGATPLEDVSYSLPDNTFYWGWTNSFTSLTANVAQVPVYSPITFTNTSGENASYVWEYVDPATGMEATSDNQVNLVLSYAPDYTDEDTKLNNLYAPPTLIASVPGKASGEYTANCLIQAGGTAVMKDYSGEYTFNIFPFAFDQDDVSGITVMDDKIGDPNIPVFGHSKNTNEYWFNYTANGDPDANPETCFNHLEGIANFYMPAEGETLVVNAVNVFGFGLIHSDAELKFSIYGLAANEYGISADPADFKVVATKTVKGSEILSYYGDLTQKDYLCIPFNFDEPVVVAATEEYPAFFFMLEGFNSDAVEYFMPYQTIETPLTGMNLGYMMSYIDFEVASGRPAYYSVKALLYTDGDEVVRPESAFAFGLIADFPWLTCDTENVTIGVDEDSVEVALGSYYDGSKLTVEASEGLVATVSGRYDECVLTIARKSESSPSFDGVVTVKGPGVEVAVNVHVDEALAIRDVIGAGAVATDTYDIYGRRIENAGNGIYIVKYSDGSVSKKVVVE